MSVIKTKDMLSSYCFSTGLTSSSSASVTFLPPVIKTNNQKKKKNHTQFHIGKNFQQCTINKKNQHIPEAELSWLATYLSLDTAQSTATCLSVENRDRPKLDSSMNVMNADMISDLEDWSGEREGVTFNFFQVGCFECFSCFLYVFKLDEGKSSFLSIYTQPQNKTLFLVARNHWYERW